MNIIGASVKLAQEYRGQVSECYLHDAPPLFGERMAIDFALAAATEALEVSDIKGSDLDLIISMSISPDHLSDKTNIMGPRICHPLQRELKADNAVVFDLHDACWTFALDTARSFMHEMDFTHALIVRTECITGLDTQGANGLAWGSGAAALSLIRTDDKEWVSGFTRLNNLTEAARIELLDARFRFRSNHRAALYFSPSPDFHASLTHAVQSLAQSFDSAWAPYIEPWRFSDQEADPGRPQLAPYAFPLSLSETHSERKYNGVITFDPFRMHLGACKVNAL